MPLVAGVDSSTSACKVRDAETGTVVSSARAPHPATTPLRSEQQPRDWETTFHTACAEAQVATTYRPSAIAVADGPQAQKQDGNRPDSADLIILAGPDAGPEVASRLCDGACSLEDIMIACGMDPATRQAISACVERLKISWREGLTAGWATRSCNDISAMTGPSCLASYCQPGRVSTSEFIASVLDCREPPIYPVYIGVRFP